jgi:protein gp37
MAETSAIEWTDATVNFWWGCTKVGPGCDHCYAETWNNLRGNKQWGQGAPRRRIMGAAAMLRRLDRAHDKWFSQHGRRRRVFMQSMSDLFDNEVDDAWRSEAFEEALQVNNLDLQFVTKRISNVEKMLPLDWRKWGWPAHIGLIVTVVNQEEADRDIPRLLRLKGKLDIPWVGLSIEPMLGRIDLTRINLPDGTLNALTGEISMTVTGSSWSPGRISMLPRTVKTRARLPVVDWVIVGGESGKNARPIDADAVRLVRNHCAAAGTAFLFKQWGEYRQTSDANGPYMAWWGKKAAGRDLDGRTHDQFPLLTSPLAGEDTQAARGTADRLAAVGEG